MRTLTAILALAALAGCARDARPHPDPRVTDPSRPLVCLTYPSEPPCSYIDDSGAIAGTDVDLARKIAAKMGRDLVVEGVEFKNILPRLKEGTADFAVSTVTITDARRRDVDFSVPYARGGACFLYKADGEKPRMSQIAMARIGVEADSVQDFYLCRHGCDPIRFPKLTDAFDALEKDDIDAVFFDSDQLGNRAKASGGRLVVTPLETKDSYGVAVDKRRPDVLAAANAVIAEGGAK